MCAQCLRIPLPRVGIVFRHETALGPVIDDADERPVAEYTAVGERLELLGELKTVDGLSGRQSLHLLDYCESLGRARVVRSFMRSSS